MRPNNPRTDPKICHPIHQHRTAPVGHRTDLDNKNLDKQLRIRRVRYRSSRPGDTHRHATEKVAHSHSETAPEERKACFLVSRRWSTDGKARAVPV